MVEFREPLPFIGSKPDTPEEEASPDDGAPPDEAVQSGDVEKRRAQRSRPRRTLPTDRMAFNRQLDTLRAFAAASGPQAKPVSLAEVAQLAGFAHGTVSLTTSFFVDVGFLNKTDMGKFIPTPVTMEFVRAWDWNKDTAAHRLAPALEQTWFAQELRKWLSIRSTMGIQDAAAQLGQVADASPEYEPQIRLLIDYLEVAGTVERDGQNIRLSRKDGRIAPAQPTPAAEVEPMQASDPEPRRPAITTTATQQPEGVVAFSIAIRVDVTELAGWSPSRISALFNGLAQVIAAKNGVEQDMVK